MSNVHFATILSNLANLQQFLDEDENDNYEGIVDFQVPRLHNNRIDLDALSDADFRMIFRFSKGQMREIITHLRFPEYFQTIQRDIVDAFEGLAILLYRLAYPCRLYTAMQVFGRSIPALSRIFNLVVRFVTIRWARLLTFDPIRLTPAVLSGFASKIFSAGAPLDCCFAFVDGTLRASARPSFGQRSIYNGHYHSHGFKYQSVLNPDGIIVDLRGPFDGRTHDLTIMRTSGLQEVLEEHAWTEDREPLAIYGDPAYMLTQHVLIPYRTAPVPLTPLQQAFNSSMSKHRIAVEWGFGKVAGLFAFIDFKKNLKVLLSPVARYYQCAVVFTNIHTCYYGSNTSSHFEVDPPAIDEYIRPDLYDEVPYHE